MESSAFRLGAFLEAFFLEVPDLGFFLAAAFLLALAQGLLERTGLREAFFLPPRVEAFEFARFFAIVCFRLAPLALGKLDKLSNQSG